MRPRGEFRRIDCNVGRYMEPLNVPYRYMVVSQGTGWTFLTFEPSGKGIALIAGVKLESLDGPIGRVFLSNYSQENTQNDPDDPDDPHEIEIFMSDDIRLGYDLITGDVTEATLQFASGGPPLAEPDPSWQDV